MSSLQDFAAPVGRVLLALIFFNSGIGKIFAFEGTTQYMASYGMPMAALFLVGAIVVEALGGLSLIVGFKARWGALALISFTIVATVIFHQFWALEGMERRMQMIMFMKNVSITGGLLLVVAYGAGRFSFDQRSASAAT